MRKRSRLVKLTVLPALATACATAPVRDDDAERIERTLRSQPGDRPAEGLPVAEEDIAVVEGVPFEGYDGRPDDAYDTYAAGGFVGGYPRYSYGRPIHRGGFGGFFTGGGFHHGGLGGGFSCGRGFGG
jgi:hypothetical protein